MELIVLNDCTLIKATEKALLIHFDGKPNTWLPRSQIEETDLEKEGDVGYVELPVWLAREKDLLLDEEEDD